MAEYHTKRAAKILQSIKYATLATITPENKPWNSPVYFNYDQEINIYWVSDKNGQHSKNIAANGEVFIVIYDSTVAEGDGEGIFIQARAEQVTDPDKILKVRKFKKGSHFEQSPDSFLGESVRYMYKAVPITAWMNDAEITNGQFIKDFRVEIPLDKLKKEINETL